MKKLLAAVIAVLSMTGCSEPSEEEKNVTAKSCQDFIKESMSGNVETQVFDIYKKKGKIVAEVGYRDRFRNMSSGDSYSVRLCVLDKEKGTLSSPSPMNDNEWKK